MNGEPLRVDASAERGAEPVGDPLLRFLEASFAFVPSVDGPARLHSFAEQLSRAAIEGPLADLLRRPSKGFRGRLAQLGYALGGGSGAAPAELSAAVELLHAGSLVVDDIEDGSAERRGQPAVHVTHGLPIALNAANYAYFVPSALISTLGLPAERELAVQRRLARTLLRCHRGQALDLSVRIGRVARRDVRGVVLATSLLKTGALVELALTMGAEVAGADAVRVEVLGRFGREVGVALQMLDDASSVRVPARREKGVEDVRNGRPTWPWAWLAAAGDPLTYAKLAAASRRVEDEPASAEDLVLALGEALGGRGHDEARAKLGAALVSAREDLGEHPLLARLSTELEALGCSYG